MRQLAIVVLVASQFVYYLLIAQTGIVEHFDSDMSSLFTLPVGGVIGSYLAHRSLPFFETPRSRIFLALCVQALISFGYPDLGLTALFFLGLSMGAAAPLFVHLFSRDDLLPLTLALVATYATGTYLFTTPPEGRRLVAIALTAVAMVVLPMLKPCPKGQGQDPPALLYCVAMLSLWIALDSSLFETLSRSETISIWRGEHRYLIIVFHAAGLLTAYGVRNRFHFDQSLIAGLFITSYVLFAMGQATLLAIVYPFAISYYNFFLLRTVIQVQSLRVLGICMIFAGWLASGVGLLIALEQIFVLAALFLLIGGFLAFRHEWMIPEERTVV